MKINQVQLWIKDLRSTTVTVSELTSESPVYSLDSPENHSDPLGLNPAGSGSSSGPGVSGGRGRGLQS